MNKYLKLLVFYLFIPLVTLGCAPQRTNFTGAKQASQGTPLRDKLVRPASLKVGVKDDFITNIKAVLAVMDANPVRLAEGDFRTMNRKNPVTKKIEHRRQTITAVDGNVARYATFDTDTNTKTFSGVIRLDEEDPFEKGLRALVERRDDDLYAVIAGFLSMNYNFDDDFATKAHVLIEVGFADYDPDPATFKIFMRVRTSGIPKSKPLVIEARFVPALPRPFNLYYVAYGTRIVADQIFLEVTNSNPAKPDVPSIQPATVEVIHND